ncbi:MAG: hypothetical protein JJ913_07370 [Rhizobiaceae bacterium]|nr:hypothetical protein [Rhizobiaceae bacterium]
MRTLLIIIAIYQGANGALMLAAPELWYGIAPGVHDTGPLNTHFIRDIGLAFLAATAALLLALNEERRTAAVIAALVFLGGHAGLHIVEMFADGIGPADALRDIVLIVVPAFLPLAILRRSGESLRRAAS